jgi:hypothetical protein
MRFGFRGVAFSSLSLFVAIACVGGENQCLNPQPDLPSCGSQARPSASGGASNGSAAGPGADDGNPSGGSHSMASGGSGLSLDPGVPAPEGGSSGSDYAGAGGDAAGPIVGGEGGAGGEAGGSASAGADPLLH